MISLPKEGPSPQGRRGGHSPNVERKVRLRTMHGSRGRERASDRLYGVAEVAALREKATRKVGMPPVEARMALLRFPPPSTCQGSCRANHPYIVPFVSGSIGLRTN